MNSISGAKMNKLTRKKEIEGLDSFRGILCVWVIMHHLVIHSTTNFTKSLPFEIYTYKFFYYADEAVDAFFSLSGFIISHVYQDKFIEFYQSEELTLRKFWSVFCDFMIKRIARLYPLVIFGETLGVILDGSCGVCLYEYFLISPFFNYFGPNVPIWSLGVEFQLYACFPFYVYLIQKINHKRNSLIYFIFTLIGPIIMILLFFFAPEFPFFNITRGHAGFLTGMACYQLYQNYPEKNKIYDFAAMCFSAIFIILLIVVPQLSPVESEYFYHVYIFYYFLIDLPFFIAKSNSIVYWFLNLQSIKFLGELSFTLYLLHYPILDYLDNYLAETYINQYEINQFFIALLFFGFLTSFSLFVYHTFEVPSKKGILKLWDILFGDKVS